MTRTSSTELKYQTGQWVWYSNFMIYYHGQNVSNTSRKRTFFWYRRPFWIKRQIVSIRLTHHFFFQWCCYKFWMSSWDLVREQCKIWEIPKGHLYLLSGHWKKQSGTTQKATNYPSIKYKMFRMFGKRSIFIALWSKIDNFQVLNFGIFHFALCISTVGYCR